MSTPTRPPAIPPRVIEHEAGAGRQVFRLPEHTLRGLLAGAEAVLLGWLLLVVPAISVYVATAASPALGTAGWLEAARLGTGAWLLGHGAALTLGDVTISVVPLGVTALALLLMAAAVRRAQLSGWASLAIAVGTYVAVAGFFVTFADVPGAPRGLAGAVVVATCGALLGQRGRYPAVPDGVTRLFAAVPTWVRLGWGAAARTTAVLAALALLAAVAAVVTDVPAISEVQASLHADPVSAVVLVGAQFLVVPTLAVWALAFLAGPGFAVGSGTSFAPAGIDAGPLPVLPVLAALPEPDSMLGEMPFLPLVVVAVGLGVGWWLRRRGRDLDLLRSLGAVAMAVVGACAVVALLVALASGGIGPGRMSMVGADAGVVALSVGRLLLVGLVVCVVATHPQTRAGLARARDAVVARRAQRGGAQSPVG